MCLVAYLAGDVEGRGGPGGGGGRGGGGGGFSRPSGGAGRSPSMSRPSGGSSSRPQSRPQTRPSTGGSQRPSANRPSTGRPGGSTRPGGSRPNFSQGGNSRPEKFQIGGSRPSTGRPGGSRPEKFQIGQQPSKGQVNDFLNLPKEGGPGTGQRPSTRPGESQRPRDGQRHDNISDNRQDRRDNVSNNRDDRVDQRRDRASDVRRDVARNNPRRDFWRDNPRAARWGWNRPYRWATWGALTGWFSWGSGSGENYYDYGGDVYYDDQNVYYGDEAVATTEEYAEQAIGLADAGAQAVDQAPDDTEWMSLGVFALTHEEKGDPTMYFQLAVAKDGTIAGTYYNSSTKQSKPVQGAVDRNTQRAAWSVGDKSDTVIETGIYNLTKDETPVLLHYGTEKTQTWLLVRMEEPAEEQTTQ